MSSDIRIWNEHNIYIGSNGTYNITWSPVGQTGTVNISLRSPSDITSIINNSPLQYLESKAANIASGADLSLGYFLWAVPINFQEGDYTFELVRDGYPLARSNVSTINYLKEGDLTSLLPRIQLGVPRNDSTIRYGDTYPMMVLGGIPPFNVTLTYGDRYHHPTIRHVCDIPDRQAVMCRIPDIDPITIPLASSEKNMQSLMPELIASDGWQVWAEMINWPTIEGSSSALSLNTRSQGSTASLSSLSFTSASMVSNVRELGYNSQLFKTSRSLEGISNVPSFSRVASRSISLELSLTSTFYPTVPATSTVSMSSILLKSSLDYVSNSPKFQSSAVLATLTSFLELTATSPGVGILSTATSPGVGISSRIDAQNVASHLSVSDSYGLTQSSQFSIFTDSLSLESAHTVTTSQATAFGSRQGLRSPDQFAAITALLTTQSMKEKVSSITVVNSPTSSQPLTLSPEPTNVTTFPSNAIIINPAGPSSPPPIIINNQLGPSYLLMLFMLAIICCFCVARLLPKKWTFARFDRTAQKLRCQSRGSSICNADQRIPQQSAAELADMSSDSRQQNLIWEIGDDNHPGSVRIEIGPGRSAPPSVAIRSRAQSDVQSPAPTYTSRSDIALGDVDRTTENTDDADHKASCHHCSSPSEDHKF